MSDYDEQPRMSTTDLDDLEGTLHNIEMRIEDPEPAEELIADAPQSVTESYGTGVHDLPGYDEGGRVMSQRRHEVSAGDPVLTGGDIDANYEQAYAVGDEAVGGTVTTPDQDIVDELGAAVGLEMHDREYLHTEEILDRRDDSRWELDPKSSEDYGDRRQNEAS